MKNPKYIKSLLLTLLSSTIVTLSTPYTMAAGGDGGGVGNTGGGSTDTNNISTLENLFQNNSYYLKLSMFHYLETILPDQIPAKSETDIAAKDFFNRISKDKLRKDIESSEYSISKNCFEKNNPSIVAEAVIGGLNGKICFDLEKFYEQNKNRSAEERLKQLTSLAFHEEVHHFQSASVDIKINETEAYAVSSYILETAIFGQIPILSWSDPRLLVGKRKSEFFTGDRAHALMDQLRKTNRPENSLEATNLKCESANIEMMLISSPAVGKTIDFPALGCSADPNILPSALEAFTSTEGFRGLQFSAMLIGVKDNRVFDATKLSCVYNSDRCTLEWIEIKK